MELGHSPLQCAQRSSAHWREVEHPQQVPLAERRYERRKIMDDFVELKLRDVRAVHAVEDRLAEPDAIAASLETVDHE